MLQASKMIQPKEESSTQQSAAFAIRECTHAIFGQVLRDNNYFFLQLMNKRATRGLLGFAGRYRLCWLAACVLTLLQRKHLICTNVQPGRRILILNAGKDEYVRDLHEIFSNDTTFQLFTWPDDVLPELTRIFLGSSLKHNTYVTHDPAIEAAKIEYRRFLCGLWRYYQLLNSLDAVISPNFGYRYQRELAAALEMQGTPFIVMQKENLNASTEERRRVWHTVYKEGRGTFGGRKILVYNQMERDLEIASGVVKAERVEIVGMPRLDRFHRWRRENSIGSPQTTCGHIKVLFFFFSRFDKLPKESGLEKNWGDFCADTHRAMIELAQARPDIEIIAKTKGIARQDEELLQALGNKWPPNFRTVIGGDAFELLTESRVVVGFNTTALIEALALGKPVIVPHFGEANDPDLEKFIIDLGEAVEYVRSPQELRERVTHYAGQPATIPAELRADVCGIMDYYVGNDDGEAGRRAYRAICRELSRSDRASH